jgi:general secretion pathway protein H
MSSTHSRGFSLLELLLVLVLVGIGVSLAVVSVDRMASRSQERQWLDKTYQSLRKLRNRAIFSSSPVEAVILFENAEIKTPAAVDNGVSVLRLPKKYTFSALPATIPLSSEPSSLVIVFYPDGTMRDAVFYLHTPSGHIQGFRLLDVSGRIETFHAPLSTQESS